MFLSGSVLFDLFDMRAKEGNYVDFVVWANFAASVIYLAAAFGLLRGKRVWPSHLLLFAALLLIGAAIGFAFHISHGGIHEQRTIGALAFRTALTAVFFGTAYWLKERTIRTIA